MLRKQLKNLEKSILKYGPLEDKELVLLDMGKKQTKKDSNMPVNLKNTRFFI
jgi:hypothetical protein